MVLTLKRWKSRTSPGIEAGVYGKNPFTLFVGLRRRRTHPRPWLPRHTARRPLGLAKPSASLPRPALNWSHRPARAARPTGRPDPGLFRGRKAKPTDVGTGAGGKWCIAGWSSPVARQAHNLKVVGSNPTPATTANQPPDGAAFLCPSFRRTPHARRPTGCSGKEIACAARATNVALRYRCSSALQM